MKKLFGTDGIRGLAGKFPLRDSDVLNLGRAAGKVLRDHRGRKPTRVLIVRDTRGSGEKFSRQLGKGLREWGIDVFNGDILCTPSVAHLVQAHNLDSGVVISASHNPPEFNGIKFFTSHGRKWPDTWENQVEMNFHESKKNGAQMKSKDFQLGKVVIANTFMDDYRNFLINTLPAKLDLSGFKIAVDCSHGANSVLAPLIFKELGAEAYFIGNKPNGNNINVHCGSQDLKKLSMLVLAKKCGLGIAFDGDGDRVIFVDESGATLDGDYIIGLLAKYLNTKHRLKNKKAVITVMANLGLRLALTKLGVKVIETPVGDRYVSEAMRKHASILGGEQSGHIILGEHLPSGDGLLTALHVLFILKEMNKPLSKLVSWIKKFPQVLLNVPVKEKKPLDQCPRVIEKISSVEKKLGKYGRVLVRYSGTEPLLRIMIEGPTQKVINQYAGDIKEAILFDQN